jgi:hypothetical protein
MSAKGNISYNISAYLFSYKSTYEISVLKYPLGDAIWKEIKYVSLAGTYTILKKKMF